MIAKQRLETPAAGFAVLPSLSKTILCEVLHHFTAVWLLRCTPAMRAGVTDHGWSVEEPARCLILAKEFKLTHDRAARMLDSRRRAEAR